MKRPFLVLVSLVLLASAGAAQEKLTLTAPIASSLSEWTISRFEVDVENSAIRIVVKGNTGEYRSINYPNATTNDAATATLITGLNTANLSTKSLRRRILERLQADGHLGAGTFSGGN